MADTTAFITLENISKQFPGVLALDNVNLTLRKGEVHCLAGQNGCGKSTIIKVISGVYHPEKGAQILLDGKLFHHLTPQLSSHYGIQVIYQDLSLFPNFSVAENIAVNRYLPGGDIWVRRGAMKQQALAAMKRIGVNIDPDKKVEKLSIADRQLVAICRAIAADARLVIMDEPTASLTRQEVNGLLRVVNELKAAGICVVFVSHRLDEVMEVADRISVMRDGKLVGTYPASELDSHELAFLMTGQRFHYSPLPERPAIEQEPLLELRNLSRRGKYQNINLSLHGGEIVSIVGLLGAGRTELCLSLFGMTHPENGEIRINGQPVTLRNNHDAIQHGIGYVSEDRLTQGLIMEQSIYDNTIVTVFDQLHTGSGLLDHRKAQKLVADLIRELNIKVSDPHLPVKTLSGGNAQRIAIAKWVATNPRILILDSPTVGVDIANKEGIYQIARDLAEQGMAVLMICDEIPEAYYNSHRVLVMRRGKLVAEFNPHQCREEEIAEVVEVINE
ncbi:MULTISPECIES: sugar ABC transporter ATP-binding protein [Citrobacter]|uniref:Sugar ABC transporter ATP-binding protein n=1 Tax=Citrobacter portucalensis TaxID=1639133 RepID=A0AAJ1JLE3_9ENTR|nr:MULTISPECIES: sugar ABC transporter ATP-binding protein [Citrobacter]EHA3709328.1 sugar ABC transporter ATP-binding protein [Citrobacter freundii]RRN88990.1 sugar ABC transporter ATP-binding protein [Morganella morganii]EHU7372964.1 sugar ABC transporter ATP-binding protein [Citrobacter freundii]EJD6665300.1 sugar ABC transporter ATP-binding protein [Citrobacter freundii]MBQ0205221.1 sugar ABC transporter ATP-binding protein [Citrobacter freundii]